MTKIKKILSAIISSSLIFSPLVLPIGAQAAQGSYQTVGLFNATNEIDSFDNMIFGTGTGISQTEVTGIGGKPVNDTSLKLEGQKDDICAVSILASDKATIAKAITFEVYPNDKVEKLYFFGRGQSSSGGNVWFWNAMQPTAEHLIPNQWNRVFIMLDTQGKARIYINNTLAIDWDKSFTNVASFKWNYLRIAVFYKDGTADADKVAYIDEVQVLNAQPTLPALTSDKYEINGTKITNIGSTVGDVLENFTYYGEKLIVKDSSGNDITANTNLRIMEDYQLLVMCGDIITGHYYFGPVELPSDYFTPQVELNLLSEKVVDDKITQIEADVNAYDEVVAVEFFKDGKSVFTDTEAPYIYEEMFDEGTYEITAKVTDVYKETGESAPLIITSECGTSPKLNVSLIDNTEYQKAELNAVNATIKFSGAQLKEGYVSVDGEKFADLVLGENTVDLSAISAGKHTIKFYAENDLGESAEKIFTITALMMFEEVVVTENFETEGSAGGTDNGLGFIGYDIVNPSYGQSVVVGAQNEVDTSKEGAWIGLSCGSCTTRVVMNFDFYINELTGKVGFMAIPASGYQRPKLLEIGNGKFTSENGTTYAFEEDRWYDVTIDINVAKKTFNLSLDGEVVMRDEKTNLPDNLALSSVRVISYLQGADMARYYALDNYSATHLSSSPIITGITSPNAYGEYQVYDTDTTMTITFSEALTAASIYPSKFTVASGSESAKIISAEYDSSAYSITLELEEPLKTGKTYRFTCAENIVMGNGQLYGEKIYSDFSVVKSPLSSVAVEITDGGVFRAEINNESTAEKTAYLIVNVFEDGKLVDNYAEAVTLNSGVNTLEETITSYSSGRTVNVFMWDSLAKPYRFAQISN